ncbi:MAG: hypothetical protein AB1679_36505 [Actinomycetota bacterium]
MGRLPGGRSEGEKRGTQYFAGGGKRRGKAKAKKAARKRGGRKAGK